MKFNKIISVINIFSLMILAGITMPLSVNENNYTKTIIMSAFILGLIVSFAFLYKEGQSDIVEKYYKVKDDLNRKIENYEHARTRLVEYVLESFNGLYTFIDVEEAFIAGYHCTPNGKNLRIYAEEYVETINKTNNDKKRD